MQCVWQNSARRLTLSCQRGRFHHLFATSTSRLLYLPSSKLFSLPDDPHFNPSSSLSTGFPFLTPAERGRAASQAITSSLRDGNIVDAYHIVNAIRLANSQASFSFSEGSTAEHSPNAISSSASHFQPVSRAFTPGVSPRLPSHTLLHGLIRQGLLHRASMLTEQMMGAGMKVRCRSLEVLFTSLAQNPGPVVASHLLRSENSGSFLATNSMSQSLTIRPGLISDSSNRFAVQLLLLARESRQRRTHKMFKALITLCLINGEIILASLIFGILVRDWQKRVQLGQLKEDIVDGQVDNSKLARRSIYDTPFPAWSHLDIMCQYIDDSISSPQTDPESLIRTTASVQALANLAHLLDRRMLPIGGLAGLLQTMYKYPFGNAKVWVWEGKQKKGGAGDHKENGGQDDPVELDAYSFFRRVLERLALRLPKPMKGVALSSRESAPAPLTLQTYNALLHYSLVHARSRRMTDKILQHMLYVHDGMEPNVVTMNILEKAVMRSRVKGINKQWVEGWKSQTSKFKNSGTNQNDREQKGLEVASEISSVVSELLDIATRYKQNHSGLVTINHSDNYTLSMRIADLIARGRPDIVVDALPALLPGVIFRRISHHDLSNASSTIKNDLAIQYDSAVRRAVAYGPVVLTSILTALMKTGRTGMAEKVWKVMKKAEQLSWVLRCRLAEKGDSMRSPWCLGIEAYTVMIMVYGKEARKGAGYGHGHGKFHRGIETGHHMVVGWGRMVQKKGSHGRRRRCRKIRRVYLGRHMGMKIYRAALKEEALTRFRFDQLHSTLQTDDSLRIRVVKNQLRLPQPDAHFFNAILNIIARRPGMTPRSRASLTRRKARSRLMIRRRKYVWEGRMMGLTEPDVRLKEVARDIRRYGFQVPLLVRRILVGRDDNSEGIEGGEENKVWLKIPHR